MVKTGKWPRSQILNGAITDVTAVVAAEVERIKKEQSPDVDNNDNDNRVKDILDTAQQAAIGKQSSTNIQNPPISVSSNGIARDSNVDNIVDQIFAQLGLGLGGNGDGGDGGDGN